MHRMILALPLALFAAQSWALETITERIARASVQDHRSEANRMRNEYRHPAQTLTFLGLEDGMSVLEIWPGGGWYTEVLAPVLRDHGTFTIANWDPEVAGQPEYRYELPVKLQARFEARPDLYDQVRTVYFSPPESASLGPAESYDMVLAFRTMHGWVDNGQADEVFAEFARVLKPGGILGVVQHRAPDGADPAESARLGYVSEAYMKMLAREAGLEFAGSSEVNGNPDDSKDYARGVWTLPPGYRLEDQDRARYAAIGESDRMTLKFRKP